MAPTESNAYMTRRGTTPKLTSQLEAEFEKREAAQVAIRPLSDDSLYADLLKTQAPDDQPAVGVLAAYSIAGGRFRWIGGEHGGLLGKPSENLSRPTLDKVGSRMLSTSLAMLRP